MEETMLITAKTEAEKVIKNLPDNSSFEDIQYHLYIAEKLSKARGQIKDGKVHTQEEVEKRLDKWIIK
jgi:hypothetical protein